MADTEQLADLTAFLAPLAPFGTLPTGAFSELLPHIAIRYHRAGDASDLLSSRSLFWLRSGAAQLHDANGELFDHIDAGGCFGLPLAGTPDDGHLLLLEDTLIYELPAEAVARLRQHYPEAARFLDTRHGRYLQQSDTTLSDPLLALPVAELMSHNVVAVDPQASVQQAAQRMSRERVSALMVVKNDRLQGIVTDRDLRNRVLAAGLSGDTPVADIMTLSPRTITAHAEALDALLAMSLHQIHHLPVIRDNVPVGMLSASDLLRLRQTSPLYLIGAISRQGSIDELATLCQQVPALFAHLQRSGVPARRIGQLLTTIADQVTARLLTLAEARLGPPPMTWCWLVLGAHARGELTLTSDQDNALLLAETPDEADAHYFAELSQWVCDGLARCGYRHCPGHIMASNPQWRLSLSQWQQQFHTWLQTPTPQALLHAGIFFDLRPVAGETGLAELLTKVLADAPRQGLFIATLARNALTVRPPLGMFGRLVLERDGAGSKGFDLKTRGIAPLVDLARVHALAGGHTVLSSDERLNTAISSGQLSHDDGRNLRDALALMASLRYRQHRRQWQAGEALSGFLIIDELGALERHQLKDAFALIAAAQQTLLARYSGGVA